MSASDFRALVDLHGGAYIGIECTDGSTIEVGINGHLPVKLTAEQVVTNVIPRLRGRMESTLHDGFKSFDFGFGGHTVPLSYYDAGQVLDTLNACVRYLA